MTKLFIAIFAPDERLPNSATLMRYNIKGDNIEKHENWIIITKMYWRLSENVEKCKKLLKTGWKYSKNSIFLKIEWKNWKVKDVWWYILKIQWKEIERCKYLKMYEINLKTVWKYSKMCIFLWLNEKLKGERCMMLMIYFEDSMKILKDVHRKYFTDGVKILKNV